MLVNQPSESYFFEVVSSALREKSINASEHTESYIAGLLDGYTNSNIPREPLAFKYLEAQPTDPGKRVIALKEIGDTSLYIKGFFPESLNRSTVSKNYYIDIGSVAYSELSNKMKGALSHVFFELSRNFPEFVDVLLRVRSHTSLNPEKGDTKWQKP